MVINNELVKCAEATCKQNCFSKIIREGMMSKGLHTLQKFLELVYGTPIQSNWVICSRNKRSKEVSGTCVQCMQALMIKF